VISGRVGIIWDTGGVWKAGCDCAMRAAARCRSYMLMVHVTMSDECVNVVQRPAVWLLCRMSLCSYAGRWAMCILVSACDVDVMFHESW
jgi:hypothetical protein